jgi:hypothetical protein
MNDLGAKVVKPSDCVLTFAIPLSIEEFQQHLSCPQRHDYARKVSPNARMYERVVVHQVSRTRPLFEALGVQVRTRLTLEAFSSLCAERPASVVIPIAHWTTTSVEFFDGFFDLDTVARTVPTQFEGILDLLVCHPETLARKIRAARPAVCVVKYLTERATPQVWLWFYVVVFKILKTGDWTYLQAIENALELFAYKLKCHCPN